MATRPQKYRISWPVDAEQIANIDEMFEDLYQQIKRMVTTGTIGTIFIADSSGNISSLAAGTSGTLLRQGTSAPEWSAVIFPNSAVQGDIMYASAANTLSLLAKSASATRYLSNTGASNAPAWAQVDLTTGVTGVLPVANGGSSWSRQFLFTGS